MAEERDKTIGAMNGPWSLMAKIALASYPLMLGWCVWVTSETFANRFFRLAGPRVTPIELRELERRIDAQFNALPPNDWRDRIVDLESQQRAMMTTLIRIESKMERERP